MIYYISKDRKRFCGRNNQQACMWPDFSSMTRAEMTFQFVDFQNQIVPLTELPGAYIAGSIKLGKSAASILFWSDECTIADDAITFQIDLRSKNISDQVTRENTEIHLEIGQYSPQDAQKVLLRDIALISPRVWSEGDPEEP